MHRIYIAGAYERKHEFRIRRALLEDFGFVVTSRWLFGASPVMQSVEYYKQCAAGTVKVDIADIAVADTMLCFTEPPGSEYTRGGRHVEFGIAMEMHKRIIVIGPRENMFYYAEGVEQYDTFAEFVTECLGPIPLERELASEHNL